MSKKKIKYFVVHVTDTPAGRVITADNIRQWHLGPFPKTPKEIIYMGKTYDGLTKLPKESIGGVPIYKLVGRGWRQVGYRDMIHLDGRVENLVPYDKDAYVDPWEITNGVSGINGEAMHIVMVGGKGKDTRTPQQTAALTNIMVEALKTWPWIQFAGHNQFDPKPCPMFDVRVFSRTICIPEKNIYPADLKVPLP